MRILNNCIALTLILTCFGAQAAQDLEPKTPKNINSLQLLLQQVKDDALKEKSQNKVREAQFLKKRDQQSEILADAIRQLKKTQATTKRLKSEFDNNEDKLGKQEEELRKRSGNLGEMFGVVRQVAQDMAAIRENSLLALELGAQSQVLNELSESKALPSISKLEALWYELQLQMTKQAEVKRFEGEYIDIDGKSVTQKIAHIGPFVAITSHGYLNYDAETLSLIHI